MKSAFTNTTLVFILLLAFTSCAFVDFATDYGIPDDLTEDFISSQEVSVRDWLTYVVATSFEESDSVIFLGDHMDKISSKLPDLDLPGWSNYTLNAFLQKDQNMDIQPFCDHCTKQCLNVYVLQSAWDSIQEFGLLDLPIVGITYEQAMDFVGFRQDLANNCGLTLKTDKANLYSYECFLPTPEQFDSVLTFGDSTNSKSCPIFNYKNCFCKDCPSSKKLYNWPVTQHQGKAPMYIWGYYPDDNGLFNLRGNVAEMTSEKGIAKGGSFQHYASEAEHGKSQTYSKPEIWLGFRVWYKVSPK